MTQPFDRGCELPALGNIDHRAGEFWVRNPFDMPKQGKNLSAYERNQLYLNLGGESFLDVSFASRADIDADSRSAIAADFNHDGAPDLLVGSAGGGALRLFSNRFPQKNRVRVELIGTTSNRSAIGARLVAECGGRKVVRDLFPANGFMGQSPPDLLLGIGDAKAIDTLTVRWPTGKRQTFRDIPAGSRVRITEGEAALRVVDGED